MKKVWLVTLRSPKVSLTKSLLYSPRNLRTAVSVLLIENLNQVSRFKKVVKEMIRKMLILIMKEEKSRKMEVDQVLLNLNKRQV
jgi:hypothetical protein